MEKTLVERFIGKKVAFNKYGFINQDGAPRTFVGILKEVTNESILIEFEGRLQVHKLYDITEMEEGSVDV